MGIRECIICCQSELGVKDGDDKDIIGTGECQNLQSQLLSILVLRTLLDIPQEMCSKFLKENGNPNSWIFWCTSCYSTLIRKAENVYHRIKLLEKQLESFRTDIKNAIVSSESIDRGSTKTDRKTNGCPSNPTHIIRSYIINDLRCAKVEMGVTKSKEVGKHDVSSLSQINNVIGATTLNDSDNRIKNDEFQRDELGIIATKSLEVNKTSNQLYITFPSPQNAQTAGVSECITLDSDGETSDCYEVSLESENSNNLQQKRTTKRAKHFTAQKNNQETEGKFQLAFGTLCSSPGSREIDFPELDNRDVEDEISHDELEAFVTMFRKRRIELGVNQAKVGLSLGQKYGDAFSQTTISRFEKLQLSFKNLCKLKPYLQNWLDEAESNSNNQISSIGENGCRKRRKRTVIEGSLKETLENHFIRQPSPGGGEISDIADSLEIDKEVVRIWFCNRRAREKKIGNQIDSPPTEEEPPNSSMMTYPRNLPPLIPIYTSLNGKISSNKVLTSTPERPHQLQHLTKNKDHGNYYETPQFDIDEYILP